MDIWKLISSGLLVLLVVSIFTQGFSSNNLGSIISDLQQYNAQVQSAGAKNAVGNAIMELEKAQDIVEGKKSAGEEVLIIEEFSDFQCPFCSRAIPILKQIEKEYGSEVEIVYKHFPLSSIHPDAQKAAEAAECAKDQDKFWEYHDKLFANQGALSGADLKQYAKELGLDTNRFNSCLDSSQKAPVVQADFQEGQQKGVTGTPTFFINGQKIVGAQPFDSFKAVIDSALK